MEMVVLMTMMKGLWFFKRKEIKKMKYNECKVIANIKRGDKPLVSKVPIDDFTNAIQNNFDYDFDGTSKFCQYE